MSNKRFKESVQNKKPINKGFYIALGICLVAIGAAAWMTYNSVVNFMEPNPSEIANQAKKDAPSAEDKQAGNTLSGIKEEKEEKEETPNKAAVTNTEQQDSLVIYPVSNNVVKGYSNSNPVFSRTLSDWRVHNATDFAAEQGSTVKAMNSGEVADVYNDPTLGMTVAITHDAGYTAYYSGLGDTVSVEKGQRVSAGDDIGCINDVPSEISDGYHLHLAIKSGDDWVDPMSILKEAQS